MTAAEPSLFDEPEDLETRQLPPFDRESETSRQAAVSMYETASTLRARVWRLIRGAETYTHGLTSDEVEAALDLRHQTASARIWELRRAGMIQDSGIRRPTRSGRSAVVWTVTP